MGRPAFLPQFCHSYDSGGNRSFHVGDAAPVDLSLADFPAKRIMPPLFRVMDADSVDMPIEQQSPRGRLPDPANHIAVRVDHGFIKPVMRQQQLQEPGNPVFFTGHAGAFNQLLRQVDDAFPCILHALSPSCVSFGNYS